MADIILAVFGALPAMRPLAEVAINPRVTSITFSSQLPGGFSTLRAGIDPTGEARPQPYLTSPVIVERRSHVVLRIGARIVWEGVVTWVSADGTQLEAEGYGLASPNWGSVRQGGDTLADTRTILAAAVTASPHLVPVTIANPGGQRKWSEFQDQTAASVITALTTAGDTAQKVALTFTVYEERATRIVPALPPAVPDYRLAYDRSLMQIGFDYGDCIDGVYVNWTDAGGVRHTTETLYRDGVTAATAVAVVPITASFPDAGAALQYARLYRDEHSEPRLTGTIRLTFDDVLTRPDGERVPGYLVRAGEWVEIEGYGSAPITSVNAEARPGTDQQTGASLVVQSVEITLGEPASTSWTAAQRKMLNAATALETMSDPTSWNRR